MKHIKVLFRRILSGECAQALAEYAVIIALISAVSIPSVIAIGNSINKSYDDAAMGVETYEYSVVYNANGGTGAPDPQVKYEKQSLVLSSGVPVREGHSFTGWGEHSTDEEPSYQPWDTYSEDADMTLFALWQANIYTISYDLNGGTGDVVSQSKTHGVEMTVTDSVPSRLRYTFSGWAKSRTASEPDYESGAVYNEEGDMVLYAVWTAVPQYTIIYNANGGSGAPASQTKYSGEDINLSSVKPTRAGYSFYRWLINSSSISSAGVTGYSTKYFPSGAKCSIDASVTLFADWTANTYTVSYNANGGTGTPSSQTKTYGVNLTLTSAVPSRSGYSFLGWATSPTASSPEYSSGGTFTLNTNTTLYAVWKQDRVAWTETISQTTTCNYCYAAGAAGSALFSDPYYKIFIGGTLFFTPKNDNTEISAYLEVHTGLQNESGTYGSYNSPYLLPENPSGTVRIYVNNTQYGSWSLDDFGELSKYVTLLTVSGSSASVRIEVTYYDTDLYHNNYTNSATFSKTYTMK